MKLYLYAYRNTVGNFYSQPFVSGDNSEIAAEKFARMVYAADEKQLNSIIDDELYLVGIFDDLTGEVTPCNCFIQNMGALASQVLAARAIKNDGVSDESNSEQNNSKA